MNNEEYQKGYDAAVEAIKKALAAGGTPSSQSFPKDQNSKLDPIPVNVPNDSQQGDDQESEDSSDSSSNSKSSNNSKKSKPLSIGDKGDQAIQDQEAEERAKNAEFDDAGNKIGDDSYTKPSDEDIKGRIKQLKDILASPQVAQSAIASTQNIINQKKLAKGARDAEKYRSTPLNRFKESFLNFIRNAVAEYRGDTWTKINKKYYGTGLLRPGSSRHQPKNIPLIHVYFDQSGSWDAEKTKVGEQAVATINQYVQKGLVKIKLFYFAVNVHEERAKAKAEGGTRGQPILDHIRQTKPDNVIIMTDSDITDCSTPTTVPGGVWLLFKGGVSQNLINNIKGGRVTRKFEI